MYIIFKLLEKMYPENKLLKDDINAKRFFIVLGAAIAVALIALLGINLFVS